LANQAEKLVKIIRMSPDIARPGCG
jgi:hypothetical protein